MFWWKCRSVIEQNFKLWKSQGNLGVRYTPYLTHRKLLQMPLADVGVEDKFVRNLLFVSSGETGIC